MRLDPLRGWGLAVSVYNSPCLRMSELQPKTAKPPLVRHAARTRDRHDFGTLEIRICMYSVEKNSHESWPPRVGSRGCRSLPTNRCCAAFIVIPAPARGRLRCPHREGMDSAGSLAGVPQPTTGSPRRFAFGLTRPIGACPSDNDNPTTAPSLQAIAVGDPITHFASSASPDRAARGPAPKAWGERRPAGTIRLSANSTREGAHKARSAVSAPVYGGAFKIYTRRHAEISSLAH